MLITDELSNALKKLSETCLINVSRTVSDFLKESAADEELCAYIERHSPEISFQDELHALARTKKFPQEPNRALPFIFSVLYIFDTNKLQPEDVISRIYPHADIDESCTEFFTGMAQTLSSSLEQAVLEDNETVAQTTDKEENAFDHLISFFTGLTNVESEGLIQKVNELTDAMTEEDVSGVKSIFYALESAVKKENISVSVLDGIKDELMMNGVIV